jgi:chromosome segregation ATPase
MTPAHRVDDDSSLDPRQITRGIPQWQVNAAIVAMLGGMTGNGVATYTGNAATAKELTEMRLDIRTITTQRADADKQVVRLETKLDEALRRIAELESQQRGARK